jgi:hypothetical protein
MTFPLQMCYLHKHISLFNPYISLYNINPILSKISSETVLAKFTKMLYKCANNLFFNELRIKCWIDSLSGANRSSGRNDPDSRECMTNFTQFYIQTLKVNHLFLLWEGQLSICKKNNNSFILVYFNYLFISCIQKNNNSFILV